MRIFAFQTLDPRPIDAVREIHNDMAVLGARQNWANLSNPGALSVLKYSQLLRFLLVLDGVW